MSVKITIDYLEDKTINISEQKFGNDSKKKLQSVQKNSTLSFGKSYICFPNLNVFSAPQQISFLKSVHLKIHQEFKEANGIFKACLKDIKREEKEKMKHTILLVPTRQDEVGGLFSSEISYFLKIVRMDRGRENFLTTL